MATPKSSYIDTLPDKPHTPLAAKAEVTWHLGSLTPAFSMLIVAAIIGLVCGVAAFLLKTVIAWLTAMVTHHLFPGVPNWSLLLLPVVGIGAAILFQRYAINRNIEHGVEQMSASIENKNYNLPSILTIAPAIASTLTLGFGGSAGAEGPIAYTGGAIGSNIARLFRMSPHLVCVMIGCGAGAGIAGIFKAPIAGALFTFEVLRIELATVPCVALILASLIAGITAYALSGFTLDMTLSQLPDITPEMSAWAILIGLFCGIYSLYYTAVNVAVRHLLERIPNIWMRGLFSALSLGACIFLFPALYGEGYGVMTKVVSGDFSAITHMSFFASDATSLVTITLVCLGVALLKSFACAMSNSGGGVCGDFAPTLFAGCIVGFLFGAGVRLAFNVDLPLGTCALIGMGAVMAGTIRAPLMAIFIVAEMTGSFALLMPLTIASFISFAIVRTVSKLNLLKIRAHSYW